MAPSEGLTSRLGGWQGSVSAQSHLSTGMPHLFTPVGVAGCAGGLDTGAHPHPRRGPGPARTHELGHTRQRSGRGLSWPPLRMPKARQGGLRGEGLPGAYLSHLAPEASRLTRPPARRISRELYFSFLSENN